MIGNITLQDMRKELASKSELCEANITQDHVCFTYNVNSAETFNTDIAREFRGTVFNVNNHQVVGRAMHKFFNVGERVDTFLENLPWHEVESVMLKRDGSMIHSVDIGDGEYVLKSKRSINSDVAVSATKFVKNTQSESSANYHEMIQDLVAMRQTVTFEWTSPDARIVIDYDKPDLQVLHIRDNATGRYWTRKEINTFCAGYNVPVVETFDYGLTGIDLANHLLSLAETLTDTEGWVIQFKSGEMVKLKTKWYLKLHRSMTFLRERDIADLVLDEKLDDLKSLLSSESVDISGICEIEAKVMQMLRTLIDNTNALVKHAQENNMTRKEFALKFKGNPLFGLAIAAYTGSDPDFKKYFRNNLLKEYFGLTAVKLSSTVVDDKE